MLIVRLGIVTLMIAIFAVSFAMVARHSTRGIDATRQAPCAAGSDSNCNNPNG